MLLSREIRRKLAALRRRSPASAPEERAAEPKLETPVQVVTAPGQLPPGREVTSELGRCFSARLEPSWTGDWAELVTSQAFAALTSRPQFPFCARHQVALLDIETTGLAAMPLFLVGILHLGAAGYHVHQFLARDYTEEPAVLVATADLLRETQLLISFNGRSFDMPYIRDRMRYHRLDKVIEVEHHWDVLLTARRLLKTGVPDRCLQTLELHLCGRERGDDIPSDQIPRAYHDFVATGDDTQLARILYHNQVDLISTAQLAGIWAEHAPVQTGK